MIAIIYNFLTIKPTCRGCGYQFVKTIVAEVTIKSIHDSGMTVHRGVVCCPGCDHPHRFRTNVDSLNMMPSADAPSWIRPLANN